ncbi:MAG: hypothetical protein KDD25_08355 [Bdellovibrionales bacterium]|nr:hypothetical protein [Bdellovibrionales bacterium]
MKSMAVVFALLICAFANAQSDLTPLDLESSQEIYKSVLFERNKAQEELTVGREKLNQETLAIREATKREILECSGDADCIEPLLSRLSKEKTDYNAKDTKLRDAYSNSMDEARKLGEETLFRLFLYHVSKIFDQLDDLGRLELVSDIQVSEKLDKYCYPKPYDVAECHISANVKGEVHAQYFLGPDLVDVSLQLFVAPRYDTYSGSEDSVDIVGDLIAKYEASEESELNGIDLESIQIIIDQNMTTAKMLTRDSQTSFGKIDVWYGIPKKVGIVLGNYLVDQAISK